MYVVRSQSDCMRKRLHLQNAIHLWKVLFGDRFTIIQPFSDFLVSSREDDVGLRQDEWNMFFTFLQKHGNDADLKSHFDFNCRKENSTLFLDAWPLLLCEFVQSL